jgi:hypothetical protein
MEAPERHLNHTQFREDGYGKWRDILVSTKDDLVDVDTCVTHSACDTCRATASKQHRAKQQK